MTAKKWSFVNTDRPCPVCGEADGSRVADDGTEAACRNRSKGATRKVRDTAGSVYYVSTIAPKPEPRAEPAPGPAASSGNPALDAALQYVAAGISIVPIMAGGSKRPALESWKELTARLPTAAELE